MMQTSSPADNQGELGGNNVGLFLSLAETGGKGEKQVLQYFMRMHTVSFPLLNLLDFLKLHAYMLGLLFAVRQQAFEGYSFNCRMFFYL